MLFNSDLKLPLWEQNLMIVQLHLHFFGSFMINFGSELCIFRSLIYTNWILFSTPLSHYFAQFRSETAIMWAKFNYFPTSAAFLDLSWSILDLKQVFLRSLIHTNWKVFSNLLGHYVVQFRSETAIMREEFNDFLTSSAFFWIFHDQFWVWNVYF